MNAAKLDKSPRLQRVLARLQQGPASTMQIIQDAGVCAVNSIISEIRENGYHIDCQMSKRNGATIAIYTLREG